MSAQLIDGKKWSGVLLDEIKAGVAELQKTFRAPGLGVILVGDNPASRIYVTKKEQACENVGMVSIEHVLPVDADADEVRAKIDALNADPTIDGILLQLPLPDHIDEQEMLQRIHPDKDVDGFHPMNVGRLSVGLPTFVSCTPAGIMELLDREGVELEGKQAVVVGRSNIVGKPMALLLLSRNATVTVCHSRTKNLPEVCAQADVLVAAVGRAEMVRGSWVKEGAVVIDVGINRIQREGMEKAKIVGDVCFEEAASRASLITPVPGGVGPMTIACLLKNTLESARRRGPNPV